NRNIARILIEEVDTIHRNAQTIRGKGAGPGENGTQEDRRNRLSCRGRRPVGGEHLHLVLTEGGGYSGKDHVFDALRRAGVAGVDLLGDEWPDGDRGAVGSLKGATSELQQEVLRGCRRDGLTGLNRDGQVVG